MPPVLLPDTNGVIMDDFLLSVQAFVTKNVCKYSACTGSRTSLYHSSSCRRSGGRCGSSHCLRGLPPPTNAMQATTTPSAASMPTVSVQLLRKCIAQLSIRTCRHGGGEHVVLAPTAVCMCFQRRGSATFSTSSLLRMKKGPNHRYIGRCPI